MNKKHFTAIMTVCLILLVGCNHTGKNKNRTKPLQEKKKPFPNDVEVERILEDAIKFKTGIYYTIRRGDTIYSISKKYDIPQSSILNANQFVKATDLEPGTVIFLPGIEDIEERIVKIPVKKDTPPNNRPATDIKPGKVSKKGYIWPTRGTVVATYKSLLKTGKINKGINIKAPIGQAVFSAKSGKVIFVSQSMATFGRVVIIRHSDGYWTMYAHLDEISVEPGKWIGQGKIIGRVGQSGQIDTPTLHFSILRNGENVNPVSYLPN